MLTTSSLTKERFTKLNCDAHAFFEVARLTAEYMVEIQCQPLSTAYISLSTAMMTNLGMCFELKLKAIQYKVTGSICRTHELVKIYDSLDAESVKMQLTEIYQKCLKDTGQVAVAHKVSKKQPKQPNPFQGSSFRDFLKYLDRIDLYDRRYSFEKFSDHEWWIVIERGFFVELFKRITAFTNSLSKLVT